MRLPVFRIFKLVFPSVSGSSHVSLFLVFYMHANFDKVKFSPLQALEALRVVKG
jgi:hypothetical protein